MIPIALPYLGEEEYEALREPLETGWLTQGPKVAAFESRFAEIHNVDHAIASTSCTTALHLILAALGVGPGDEVIVPSFTWVASANVVLYCGATPVLADVDRTTFNLDPADVAKKITDRTRAVIAVHLFGLCADMDGLRSVLPEGMPIIEDAACAAGATYNGVFAGGLGAAAAFSFHPRKSITTGEGGMVTTQDADLAEIVLQLRNHGATVSEEQRHHGPKPYILPDFNMLGFNYRMTDLQGAVGLQQVERLLGFIEQRDGMARKYHDALQDIDWLSTPVVPDGYRHGWQSYVCYVDPDRAPMTRNAIMEQLQDRGVSTRPGTHSVHMLDYYKDKFGYSPDDLPAARDCAENTMAIPLHNRMSGEDLETVISALHAIS